LTERYAQPAQARLTEKHIEDLENVLNATHDETLSLKDAAAACGYAADSLGRMVKRGALRNYGTPSRPRVKRGELPKKSVRECLHDSAPAFTVLDAKQIARAAITLP
jgi:hypothetical protein